MTNDELNGKLAEIADRGDLSPRGLESSGKAVPYYGWFWRTVDFDRRISFAYANGGGFDVPSWVGFCENNKWDYEEFVATPEQSAEVKRLAMALVEDPTRARAQALFDYLQSIKPEHVMGLRRWGSEERSTER